jgi:hypothetical protein
MDLTWRFGLALKNVHFLGGFIRPQGNDISLGVQFCPSWKLLAPEDIQFSGSVMGALISRPLILVLFGFQEVI